MNVLIQDRVSAGQELAQWLTKYRKQPEVLVLALSRGGVPVAAEIARELHAPLEIEQRMKAYRGDRAWPEIEGKRVILVDEGVVSGATMRAAIASLRPQAPGKLIIAVPVAPFQSLVELRREADEVVCLATPEPFQSVGACYASYAQLSDGEICRVLSERWATQDLPSAFSAFGRAGSDSASG